MRLTILFLLLPFFSLSQTYDSTASIKLVHVSFDTNYYARTVCDTLQIREAYDSVYKKINRQNWRPYLTIEKKRTDSIRNVKSCQAFIDTVISDNSYKTTVWTYTLKSKAQLTGNATRQSDWVDTSAAGMNVMYFRNVPVIVLRMDWADLQPTETGQLNTSYIDKYIIWANRVNAQYGLKIKFKLRLVTGVGSPDWVKKKVGTFILTSEGYEDVSGLNWRDSNCVKFWTSAFMPCFDNLMSKLSKKYDTSLMISEVVNSATATGTGEALIRAVSNSGGGLKRKNSYLAAGYTIQADFDAVIASINVMAKYWKKTNVGMAITLWETIDSKKVQKDSVRSRQVAEYLCKTFSVRAVIGNNGLGTPGWETGGDETKLGQMFMKMKATYGNYIYYQTAAPAKMISPIKDILNLGLVYGSSLVELPEPPNKILQRLTQGELLIYNQAYQNNGSR